MSIWFTVCKADGWPSRILNMRRTRTLTWSIVTSAKPRLPDFSDRCNPISSPFCPPVCAFLFSFFIFFFFFILRLRISYTVCAFSHSNSLCSRPRKFIVGMHGREVAKSSSPFFFFFFFFSFFLPSLNQVKEREWTFCALHSTIGTHSGVRVCAHT